MATIPQYIHFARRAGEALRSQGQTVAVAESSAGGLIAAALLSVPGASSYFLGCAAVYTTQAKRNLLGVTEADFALARASTETHALVLARAARARLGTTWGVGETGAAGPTGNRYGDAPGHCCLAISGPIERAITVETQQRDRWSNMEAFAEAALNLLAEGAEGTAGDRAG